MTGKRKLRVLIADDEPHIRLLIKTVMTSMNAEIVGEAKNGGEAVEVFRNEKPDITLLDINMPIKSGEDALKEIMEAFPDAFVIMLTSVADMMTVEKCLGLGAANYIRKDTPIPEMKEIIKRAWDDYRKSKNPSNR